MAVAPRLRFSCLKIPGIPKAASSRVLPTRPYQRAVALRPIPFSVPPSESSRCVASSSIPNAPASDPSFSRRQPTL